MATASLCGTNSADPPARVPASLKENGPCADQPVCRPDEEASYVVLARSDDTCALIHDPVPSRLLALSLLPPTKSALPRCLTAMARVWWPSRSEGQMRAKIGTIPDGV